MSYILHIDTSAEKATIAASHNGKCLHQKINEDARNHAATINLLVDEVLYACKIQLTDLKAVSVIGGPGSYTGLRIGLATAKGYCYALDLPLIMINKLDLLALQHQKKCGEQFRQYLAALKAREGEYFMCLYNNDGTQLIPPRHVMEDELIQLLHTNEGRTAVISSALYERQLTANDNIMLFKEDHIELGFWCNYTSQLFICNSFVNLSLTEPFYLKQVYTHNKL